MIVQKRRTGGLCWIGEPKVNFGEGGKCAPEGESDVLAGGSIHADKPFAVFEGLFPAALGAVDLDDNIDQDVLDAKISDDLFANLKHISLEDMNCLPNDMWFMKVLLSKAGLLQSFVVTLDYGGETESYEEACAELEAFERASPQAQLELRLAEMPDYLEDF
uniref:FBD domain-containing protein n=1 Tax=Hordeum vulgare subsp. vulgare TaxID=112509 RepID=A0A2Z5WH00_HORVV|nr:hypothetical protein [Hordeum vulgare subsp. vulgare]